MPVKKYKPGEFCWTELGTPNPAGAKKFYRSLFGWKFTDYPMGGGFKYSIAGLRGKDVCGLYPMMPARKGTKAAPYWLPYVSVKSVDAMVKKATAAGAKVVTKPMDVMEQGRSAVLRDPTGAVFAFWQARAHGGAAASGDVGTVGWHDLNTRKPEAAAKFYTKAIGWKMERQSYSGNAYYLMKVGKESIGGIWPESMKKLPPCWITYWQVENCAKATARVRRLGGRVLMGPITVPEMVHFAIARDPYGAVFAIMEPIM